MDSKNKNCGKNNRKTQKKAVFRYYFLAETAYLTKQYRSFYADKHPKESPAFVSLLIPQKEKLYSSKNFLNN